MKRYRVLRSENLAIEPKSTIEFDAATGCILLPSNDKVYLHWKKPNGELYASCTLIEPTLVSDKLNIINNNSRVVYIQSIRI